MQINTFPGYERPGRNVPQAGLKTFSPKINRDAEHRRDKTYQSVVNRAFDRYRAKGWVEEHHALYTLASGLRWPLHLFSLTLASLFAMAIITQAVTGDSLQQIWQHRSERLDELYLPMGLVLLALLCLEWAKSVVFDQAATGLLKRKFAVGGAVLLVALVLSGASFYSSVMGGDVWGDVSTTPELSELKDPEKIRQYWSEQVRSTQDNIDRIETRLKKQDSWQDRKPGGTLDRLHKEKESALKRMAAEMDAAEAANAITQRKAAVDGFFAGQVLAYTSAGIEVLILLCLFYLSYHQYRVASEVESGVSEYQPSPAGQRPGIGFQPFSPAPAMREDDNRIGFRMSGSAPAVAPELAGIVARLQELEMKLDRYRPGDPPPTPSARTVTVHNHTEGFPIICEHCGEEAVMKSPKAKYCSEQCKKEAWNLKNPENQVRFN